MAEYNVQINKYNANNLGYDQLYPQPMEHADTHLLNGSDPINVGELGVSNRNILDNWYFANPVNQRGQTSYTGAGYGIDRWKSLNDNLSIIINLDGTITLKNNTANDSWFVQVIDIPERFRGKNLNLSILGTAKTGNCYINLYDGTDNLVAVTENGISTSTKVVGASATVLQFVFYIQGNSELTIKAAKLELGFTQTLAHQDEDGNWVLNEIPDYGEQLARCQRFYEKFLFCNGEGATPVGVRFQNAIGSDADLVTIGAYIYFATQKRTVPVVRIEYDIADGPTQTATVNWVDERCFSSTNIIVPAGKSIDIHWYEAIADL